MRNSGRWAKEVCPCLADGENEAQKRDLTQRIQWSFLQTLFSKILTQIYSSFYYHWDFEKRGKGQTYILTFHFKALEINELQSTRDGREDLPFKQITLPEWLQTHVAVWCSAQQLICPESGDWWNCCGSCLEKTRATWACFTANTRVLVISPACSHHATPCTPHTHTPSQLFYFGLDIGLKVCQF